MKTVEETLLLCQGGADSRYDPLYKPDDGRVTLGDGWIYIRGEADDSSDYGYADDLLIVLHIDGWALFWRDPKDAEVELWGRDWCGGRLHSDWGSLVGEAYSL